eukprot:457379-Pyramimonas_sp.AAC.1
MAGLDEVAGALVDDSMDGSSTRDGGGDETYQCEKCSEDVTYEDLLGGSLSKCGKKQMTKPNCAECIANYKAIAKKWQKDMSLKKWWQAKSSNDKVEWYRQKKAENKGRQATRGVKRNLGEVSAVQTHRTVRGSETRARIHWQPWSVFLAEGLKKGQKAEQLVAEWRLKLMDSSYVKKVIKGHVCLGIFLGMFEDDVEGNLDETTTNNNFVADNPDALAAALQQATPRFHFLLTLCLIHFLIASLSSAVQAQDFLSSSTADSSSSGQLNPMDDSGSIPINLVQ